MTFRRFCARLLPGLLLVALPATAAAQGTPAYQNKPVRVFILAGQSNMVGFGVVARAPQALRLQPDVLFDATDPQQPASFSTTWETLGEAVSNMGPEIALAGALRAAYPDDQICLVKTSESGTSLDDWRTPGRREHDALMARIGAVKARLDAAAIAGQIPSWSFQGFFWMQGEIDALGSIAGSETYQERFDSFAAELRTVTSSPALPIVLGRISSRLDPSVGGLAWQPQLDNVRNGQVAWASGDPHGNWVNTDDLTLIDIFHFGSVSQLLLGQRFAQAWLQVAELRPGVVCSLAPGQTDRSASSTLNYLAVFSQPVNGFDSTDVRLTGTTGAAIVTVDEIAPRNGTAYSIRVQGMTQPGVVDISVPLGAASATIGGLSSLPSFGEGTAILWTPHGGVAKLLLYDPMEPAPRAFSGSESGVGFSGAGWQVDNNEAGYAISAAAPLTSIRLVSTPGYAEGAGASNASARELDLEKTFRPWMSAAAAGAVDLAGTELWISYLVKPLRGTQPQRVAMTSGTGIDFTAAESASVANVFGTWSLNVLGTAVSTGVPVEIGQSFLMVLQLQIGGASSPSTARLWVNPPAAILGGANPPPASATAAQSVTSANFRFSRLHWYPGSGAGDGALDEVRIGTTFAAVTPATGVQTVPAPPTVTGITTGDGLLALAFTAPPADGGAPITNYEHSIDNGSTWAVRIPAGTTSPIVLTGLTNGTAYPVRLRAVNAVGSGVASAATSATPSTVPGRPTIAGITAGDTTLSLDFTAPAIDGGAPISNYEYSTDSGSTWTARSPNSALSPLDIMGLVNGATYAVTLRAVNTAGAGPPAFAINGTPNTVPRIGDIANQTIPMNGSTGALPFAIVDAETPGESLIVAAASSDTLLIPTRNIVLGGTGAARTVTVTPAANGVGVATVTLTVTDDQGWTATDTFTVTATNSAPRIGDVADQTIPMNGTTGAVAFVVLDAETAVESLTVTATSSDDVLIPPAGIVLGGGGTSRTVSVTPAAGRAGTATITLTVTDGGGSAASDTFLVTVINSAPGIGNIPDVSIPMNGTTAAVAFVVFDAETPVESLIVTATSSDTTLIPAGNIVLGGSGANRTITVTPAPDQSGTATITVRVTDGALADVDRAPLAATDTFVVTVRRPLAYYLAEGATGPLFDLDLALANPSPTAAPVSIRYLKEDGSTVSQSLILAAQARHTILVNTVPELGNTAVASVVISTDGLPVAVERTMTWGATGYGAHTEKAAPGADLTWYFAEGSEQGFFDTFLLLANPQTAANRATVRFLVEGGSPVTRVYDLAPTSRTTVYAENVEDPPGTKALVNKAFGIIVSFDRPGLAERAMYFGASPLWNGGHESAGVTAPATSWFHAEGATGPFFDTFILLSNPNSTPATVTLRFLLDGGMAITRTKMIAAAARLTVDVEHEDPLLANAAMVTQISSDLPVVSERTMYWAGRPDWYEAHNSFGVTSTWVRWVLGEGRVGGTRAYETYILLANPGAVAGTVTVTYLREGGRPAIVRTYSVASSSRFTVHANTVPGLASGERFGALVESTVPIAVERSMYSNASSQPDIWWAAGTNATAAPIPH